jgi:prepilin-type processing-associated H-X9-DG protein
MFGLRLSPPDQPVESTVSEGGMMRASRQRPRTFRDSIGLALSGFTIMELLVTIGVMTVLISLLLPAVQAVRKRACVITCRSHLKQLALASLAYDSTFGAFPYTSTSWFDSNSSPARRHNAVSPHRGLMPFLEPVIAAKINNDDPTAPGWTKSPPNQFISQAHRELQTHRVVALGCPSDNVPSGATSYRGNLGISVHALPPSDFVESISQKGAFVNGRAIRPNEFRDGLSVTALYSERVVGDYDSNRYDPFRDLFADGQIMLDTPSFVKHCRDDATLAPPSEFSFAGGSWLFGGYLNTWYLHVLPPNSAIPDCSHGPCCVDGGIGIITARSLHGSGVNVALADGAVRFVANQIELQVWHALGTRNLSDQSVLE